MESSLQMQAQGIHTRLTSVGIFAWDPTLILSLLQTLLSCWRTNHETDPAQARIEFERRYNKNPKRMRRRISEHVIYQANQKGHSPTVEQVNAYTDAFIEQVLSTDQNVAAICCADAGVDDDDAD